MTAKSALNELEVGRKRVIKKIETFHDLMITTKTDEARKAKILELLRNNTEQLYDEKFNFKISDTYWYQRDDPAFFMEVVKILKEQVNCQDSVY